jgi:hypothetical protein
MRSTPKTAVASRPSPKPKPQTRRCKHPERVNGVCVDCGDKKPMRRLSRYPTTIGLPGALAAVSPAPPSAEQVALAASVSSAKRPPATIDDLRDTRLLPLTDCDTMDRLLHEISDADILKRDAEDRLKIAKDDLEVWFAIHGLSSLSGYGITAAHCSGLRSSVNAEALKKNLLAEGVDPDIISRAVAGATKESAYTSIRVTRDEEPTLG